jgi:O-antigen ligase
LRPSTLLAGLLGFLGVALFLGIAPAETALALAGLAGLAASRDSGAKPTWLFPSLALYFGVQIVSVLLSLDPRRSFLCLRGDLPVLFLPLLVWLMGRLRKPHTLVWAYLAGAALSGLYGVWQFVFGFDLVRGQALKPLPGPGYLAVGFFGGHLTYGGQQMLATLLALGLLLETRGRERGWLLFFGLAAAAGLVASGARTAWAGAAAGGVLLVAMGGRRGRLAAAAMAVAFLLFVAAVPGLRQRAAEVLALGTMPRWRLWQTALRIWADHPLFGAGLGMWKILFPVYKVAGPYASTGHPHQDVLNVLVHSGLAGLLAFGNLWGVLWIRLQRLRSLAPRGLASGAILGASAAIVGFLVAGLGQCYFTDEESLLGLWYVVTLGLTITPSPPHGEVPARDRNP